MKKTILIATAIAFVLSFGTVAFADTVLPGAYAQQDQSVMGVGQTMMELGASARAATNLTNIKSRAHLSRSSNIGFNVDYQFGQSQTDQSWKAAQTVEEAQVRGLVAGDCQGDNSTDAYRRQMNQDRKGYLDEPLVPNSTCGDYHPTYK